jgi:hypothetical protein
MSAISPPCFLDRLANMKRGGADLVAESESLFSKEVFVFHELDETLLQKILSFPLNAPFVIILIGIPGVGKTELLSSLIRDESMIPKSIKGNSLWKKVRDNFNFMNLSAPLSSKRSETKKNVWLVPTVDEYYSTSGQNRISALLKDISKLLAKGDSIVLAGNMGMFLTKQGDRDPCQKIIDVVGDRVGKNDLHQHVDSSWIKEYGGNPQDVDSNNRLSEFSVGVLSFVDEHIKACSSSTICSRKSVCNQLLCSISNTIKQLSEKQFTERLCDVLYYIRLRHKDVYLTPRALLIFWADFCGNLLDDISSGKFVSTYDSLYRSTVISSLHAQSYSLEETGIDVYRSADTDKLLLNKYSNTLSNSEQRRSARLQIYFNGEITNTRFMINNGAYSDFIDQKKSIEVIKKVFKYFFIYADGRFQRKLAEIDDIVTKDNWISYTFLSECWTKNKKEYFTNIAAIEAFINKYSPITINPTNFKDNRSHTISLNLRESSKSPSFEVDMETFLPFRVLGQGFYLDFSLYPDILAKIEIVLNQSKDAFRTFLMRWFAQHITEQDLMFHTLRSNDGILERWENPWT